MISYTFGLDSFQYYLQQNSVFIKFPNKDELVKFDYKISKDTLWTSIPIDNQYQNIKYFKSNSQHYFDDIKLHLGIDLNLPMGYSKLVGIRLGNSIYLPKQKELSNQFKIFVNNEQFLLDSLLHEKLFKLRLKEEFTNHNVVGLYIDSEIEYHFIKLLKTELRKAGFYKIAFISNPLAEKFYESNIGLNKKLFPITQKDNFYINPIIKKGSA